MPGLSQNISRLTKLRRGLDLPQTSPTRDRLQDLKDFGSNPGNLRARTYIPLGVSEQPALVVVLHGCTQSAGGYDHGSGWSELADRFGFILLFPEQDRANNPNLCFNWFSPVDNRRGHGEAHSITQMIETMASRHRIDRSRIFVTGLSAGGAMTSVMLASYPEIFAGGAIIAGLPYGVATSVAEAFQAMGGQTLQSAEQLALTVRSASAHKGPWPRVSVWHGSSDRTVDVSNARSIVEQWRTLHAISGDAVITKTGGYVRRAWRDDSGSDAIDEYIIAGMGHGVPLDPSGDESCGAVAPYMLDVGVSSSVIICKAWGLTNQSKGTDTPESEPDQPDRSTPSAVSSAVVNSPRLDRLHHEPKRHSPPVFNVQRIIEDALRSAGLMK
jgi:poly(hydroxyalkanoate) depolymerase family esterase